MLTVSLDPELERRLASLAKQRGQTDDEFARDLLEASLEDLEDIRIAEARLTSRERTLTLDEAKAALDLDDRIRPEGDSRPATPGSLGPKANCRIIHPTTYRDPTTTRAGSASLSAMTNLACGATDQATIASSAR